MKKSNYTSCSSNDDNKEWQDAVIQAQAQALVNPQVVKMKVKIKREDELGEEIADVNE